MANLIARIAVLLVLAAAGMVLADRKEKIDLSVSLLLFLAAAETGREKKKMNANRTSGCEHPCKSAGRMFFEFSCKFKKHPGRIALQSDIAEELHMEGDAARIHQLVSLLVDNAVKYTPEGGKIHIFWRKNGKKAEFSVQNTCDTLPEGDLNRLFDRFYRADASRARESGGYGIGLSVAAAIVKAHKGKITAERTRDGICFKAVFPAKG